MKLEDKIKLFGHFLFCEVRSGKTTITMQSIDGNTGCIVGLGNAVQLPIEECKLVLKELKAITRRDAVECAYLANLPSALYKNWEVQTNNYGQTIFSFPDDTVNYRNMIVFTEDRLTFKQVDYLRSAGYAINVPKELYVTGKNVQL